MYVHQPCFNHSTQKQPATFQFDSLYVAPTILLLIIEILIAAFLHDRFVRPYIGDFLVVILIYSFLRCFWKAQILTVCLSVLAFAYIVETFQYFNIVSLLHLAQYRWANIVIGNSFEWRDMLAYTLGILLVYFIEVKRKKMGKFNMS